MKSRPTPHTHVGETRAELTVEFGASRLKHSVTVPAGTRVIKLDGGSDPWVVDNLSFMENKNSMAYHDAEHYGIRVPEAEIVNIRAA